MLIEADFKEASSALTAPPVIRYRRMKVPAGRVRREPGLLSSVCWNPFGEILDRWRRDDGAIACGHVPLSSGTDLSADHRRMGRGVAVGYCPVTYLNSLRRVLNGRGEEVDLRDVPLPSRKAFSVAHRRIDTLVHVGIRGRCRESFAKGN